MPAVVCDLDHRQPFGPCGGTTCRCNTDPLCEHHHRLKHEGGWTHERDPVTGESQWTSPRGTVYGRSAHSLPHGPPIEPPNEKPWSERDDPPPFQPARVSEQVRAADLAVDDVVVLPSNDGDRELVIVQRITRTATIKFVGRRPSQREVRAGEFHWGWPPDQTVTRLRRGL